MTDVPNVAIVVADTTRVDEAFDPEVAPTLAELGSEGTRATRTISPAPWTLPSHASMLTGTVPARHGAHADHELLEDDLPVLPEAFRSAGYETVCVSNNTWLGTDSGLDRGFDTLRQMWQLVQSDTALGELVEETEESRWRTVLPELTTGNPLVNVTNLLYRRLVRDRSWTDDGAERTTGWIDGWLSDRPDDRPFFLLANYLEPHLDYEPPRRLAEQYLPEGIDYDEATDVPQKPWNYLAGQVELDDREFAALRGLYRAEVAYVDEQLAALREALIDADEWEDTILVVVADHGENLGENGLMDHQYCLYDTLVHVPLVVHGPGFDDAEITDLLSLLDIAPTLLDAAGIDAPDLRESAQGQSFHPSAGSPDREFVVSEYYGPQPTMAALERHVGDLPEHLYQYDRSLRAIRTDQYKFVRGSDGSRELYDLVDDPGETTDVSDASPRVVSRLEADLDEWLASFEHADAEGAVEIDGQRKAQLERLGYLQ